MNLSLFNLRRYEYTGQSLVWDTKQQQKQIETDKIPGTYTRGPFHPKVP